jgi:predicted transcriptional regulator
MKAASVKIPTTLTLSPEHRDTLDAFAAQQERSRSWVVTQALSEYIRGACGGATQ